MKKSEREILAMKNNVFRLFMLGTLAASLLIVPAAAEETAEETAVEETAEEAEAAEDTASGAEQAWDVTGDLEDGIYTISIKAAGTEKEGWWW